MHKSKITNSKKIIQEVNMLINEVSIYAFIYKANLWTVDKEDTDEDEEKVSKVFLINVFLNFCLYRAVTVILITDPSLTNFSAVFHIQ